MTNNMKNIAQVGCGYWGPNLLRNFDANKSCHMKTLADFSEERRQFVRDRFPEVNVVDNLEAVFDDPEIDAVIVATPAGTHFELAKRAILSGKHVFVEKPLATSVAEVDELERLSKEQNVVVFVGHTFLYNAAVRHIKGLIDSGELGDVRYIYSRRLNLGRIRDDIDSWWNLAPHDVSIVQYWLNDMMPDSVTRNGMDFVQKGIDDVVFVNASYPGNVMVNIHVSWLDPYKTREMVIVGSRKMVVYDDTADHKVAIYDKGIDVKAVLGENMDYDQRGPLEVSYRSGEVFMPDIKFVEPLKEETSHFIDCISSGAEPITGIKHAREVVRILELGSRR